MTYRRQTRIEFNHCDPAGIVFFPRYYELANSICENFFREEVGHSYHAMFAEGTGVPTARIETDFRAPSRLGEVLDWTLVVERLGGSSVTFRLEARCDGEHRLTSRQILVWLGPDHRPARWPAPLRARLAAHQEQA